MGVSCGQSAARLVMVLPGIRFGADLFCRREICVEQVLQLAHPPVDLGREIFVSFGFGVEAECGVSLHQIKQPGIKRQLFLYDVAHGLQG